ncbi:putative nima-interacting protein [Golovinomyces cichoracearum]|uniref:Putative nima-interacting protein n=1 Tax=Golovinomyces cichoracearum TaxID=62708 RepID=A0A420HUW0_9PEZI|nr:putative nima-interacting protein [Golovinomyces cichoracearum]
MVYSNNYVQVLICAFLLLNVTPVIAFGAGNIASVSKIEGVNWRHGDIEDTLFSLLMARVAGGKKFDKLSVSRVYFGNWLRDYSQAIDVGTVKYVSAEAIRVLLWVLGFMTFGYGTKEFEVTADRLGCYRPEDHIDNPKDYADNVDASQYDARLRGPVNEHVELAIDPQTGMKNYIANERLDIMTSALHVRRLFKESVRLGRSYAVSKNNDDLYEALRLLGTGLHCLEDYPAHSNFIELALIELGEHDVFPHVGSRTRFQIQGVRESIYPIVTGTFGGVDFLHSVLGEFNDKATQSEIQELEGTIKQESKGDTSLLKELLGKIPKTIFEGKDHARKIDNLKTNSATSNMNNLSISSRQPEEFSNQIQEIIRQIYPVMEWHDDIMKSIIQKVEKIPLLPNLITTLEEQINIFVFSLIAPYVLPLINQVKNELNTGSSEIIQSSKEKQMIVFDDDHADNPTHSMLSKDHFSNILNEPAGKIAAAILKWVVPQLMQCWDDTSIDVDRTINRIIGGTFYHPALRDYGEDGAVDGRRIFFSVVERWWSGHDSCEQNELRQKLSREGVRNGKNHQGNSDSGHGCGHPLKMNKTTGHSNLGSAETTAITGLNSLLGNKISSGGGFSVGKITSKAAGGGVLGSLIGAIADGVGETLLSSGKKQGVHDYSSPGHEKNDDYKDSHSESISSGNKHHQGENHNAQKYSGNRIDENQTYSHSSQYGGRPSVSQTYNQSSQFGGRPSENQTYNQSSQYGGRSSENQTYNQSSQYGGRSSERQDYNQPDSQYGGRSSERQDYNQPDSQYGGRSSERQDYNQPDSQYGGRSSEMQDYNQPDSQQDYNQPSSEYSASRLDTNDGQGYQRDYQNEYSQNEDKDYHQNQQNYNRRRHDGGGHQYPTSHNRG